MNNSENPVFDEREPGAYPQDDGTVDVVLKRPLTQGSGDTTKTVFFVRLVRAPTPAEADKAGGRAMILQMYDSAHKSLLPKISEPTITPAIYERMTLRDQQSLIMGVCSFFGL